MKSQHGGLMMGLIVGLLVGLAVALGVALYVNKVPVPFIDKVPQRTHEQDAAELERNRGWDPNGPLAGKPAQRPASDPAPDVAPPPLVTSGPVKPPPVGAAASKPARDPAAILSGGPVAAITPPSAAASADRSTKPAGDPFTYFVQVGAFSQAGDAEQQRARLGMLGFAARITEREQSGRTVFRVRLGPFEKKVDADIAQERLKDNTIESALVRVER